MTQERERWIDAPVYVTGLMKTGSTLLLALLDGHPELLVYPDEPSFERLFGREYADRDELVRDFMFGTPNPLHFNRFVQEELLAPSGFSPRDWRAVPNLPALDELGRGALAEQIELRGVEPGAHEFDVVAYHQALADELSALRDVDRRGAVVATARALAVGAGRAETPPARWLFKQPLSTFRRSSFEWFFGAFPRGSAVVLVRDPRAYVMSLLDYVDRNTGGRWSALARASYFVRRLATLEDDYRSFASTPAEYGSDRVLVVRYEDLITDTERAMRELARFLGLRFDPSLVTPSKAGGRVRVPTATRDGGDRVYTGSLDRYRRDLGRARVAMVDAAIHSILESPACPYAREAPAVVTRALHGPVRAGGALLSKLRPMERAGAPR
jgi:hypothetical protein